MNRHRPEWHRLAKAQGIEIGPADMLVRFDDGRAHRLQVTDVGDQWLLEGLVVRHAAENFDEDPQLAAAVRNRQMQLCGLSVNKKGHLVARALVPKAGLEAAEFQIYARHLAAECDRLEYLLTGRDRDAAGYSRR